MKLDHRTRLKQQQRKHKIGGLLYVHKMNTIILSVPEKLCCCFRFSPNAMQ